MATDTAGATEAPTVPLAELVGSGAMVPCVDGGERPYRDLDGAASTPALASVAARVAELLPSYSSVHRGAGYKSRLSTQAYEEVRRAVLTFARRDADRDVAVLCRNTTEAINHLAYRLRLEPDDVVATTVVEHHANLLPWARVAQRRWVECGRDGTFGVDDVVAVLDQRPRPAVLALTGASNVTGWLPPIAEICAEAHGRGVPVVLDAAQLAPHRPLPAEPDYVAFSGHKVYAPYGAGALIGPRATFSEGDPFLAGGGAVDLVDLDEVLWTAPPEREEAGSPNVLGAAAMASALGSLTRIGWDVVERHERALGARLRDGLRGIPGVALLGPGSEVDRLGVASFTVAGMHHALVAARLSAEWGIGVRHGCFCAHPYLLRLLGVPAGAVADARRQLLRGDRRHIPGAVRASVGLGTTAADVDALVDAVRVLAGGAGVGAGARGAASPVRYVQDPATGDFAPDPAPVWWHSGADQAGGGCARG